MQSCQPSKATLEPTLAGKDPRPSPRVPCPYLPYTVHTPEETVSAMPFLRDKGTEGGHGTGATALPGTFLCLWQAQVYQNPGRAEGSVKRQVTVTSQLPIPCRQKPLRSIPGLRPFPCLHGYMPTPPSERCPHPQGQAASQRWRRQLRYSYWEEPTSTPVSSAASQAPT